MAKYIEESFDNRRVIASADEGRIKGAVETSYSVFATSWSAAEITSSYEAFKEYVQYANIEGFVIVHSVADGTKFEEYVLRLVSEMTCEKVIEDTSATFYQISF